MLPNTPTPSLNRIASLQSLRGIASLAVLFIHVAQSYPSLGDIMNNPEWVSPTPGSGPLALFRHLTTWTPLPLLWSGHIAVLLFFVLSGYVLSLPYLAGRAPRWHVYLVRRMCRLYIPFAAIIVIALACRAVALDLSGGIPTAVNWPIEWAKPVDRSVILDHIFMLGQASANVIDSVTWSLVHEVRISIFFPFLVLAMMRLPILVSIPIGAAIAFISQKVPVPAPDAGWPSEFVDSLLLTIYYVVFFVFGIEAARLGPRVAAFFDRLRGTAGPTGTAWILGVMMVGALILLNADRNFGPRVGGHYFICEMLEGIGAASLLALAAAPGFLRRALEWSPFIWIGEISYSLYLVHFVVLMTLTIAIGPRFAGLITLVIAIPAASLFHTFVEAPATRFARNLGARRREANVAP